jgi:hypothetical protein
VASQGAAAEQAAADSWCEDDERAEEPRERSADCGQTLIGQDPMAVIVPRI